MATIRSSLPHEARTVAEPRENRLESVVLSHIREINENIRLLRLSAADPTHTIKWLDTFIPGLKSAGGFTITSTPSEGSPSPHSPPFLELAVQKSTNPPAQWFWRPPDEILGTPLTVRVGGSFTWPPPNLDPASIDRLVLIAGGVGVNPLISIFSHLLRQPRPTRPAELHFVYATKAAPDLDRQKILFLPRLMDLVAAADDHSNVTLRLFVTGTGHASGGGGGGGAIEHGALPNHTFGRRAADADLVAALDGYRRGGSPGGRRRGGTVCYVCGPPRMTDEIVGLLRRQRDVAEERVLCEKWW